MGAVGALRPPASAAGHWRAASPPPVHRRHRWPVPGASSHAFSDTPGHTVGKARGGPVSLRGPPSDPEPLRLQCDAPATTSYRPALTPLYLSHSARQSALHSDPRPVPPTRLVSVCLCATAGPSSVRLSARPPVCLSERLSVCLSVRPCVSLSALGRSRPVTSVHLAPCACVCVRPQRGGWPYLWWCARLQNGAGPPPAGGWLPSQILLSTGL